VDGVRAKIEFLTITGSGEGVIIDNRADVRLTCNDISDNEADGVGVLRSSNAVLRDNTLSGNGTRKADPVPFFDCGLFVTQASSVLSLGNTYEDNQYCAISALNQASFRSGDTLPRDEGADPTETDTVVERGCTFGDGTGCFTDEFARVAVEAFNGGLVDLRNTRVGGEMRVYVQSSFRVDGNAVVKGNILVDFNSAVRVRSREIVANHAVTYFGTLSCDTEPGSDGSFDYFSDVQCGETCSGAIPGSCGGP
jgi:parallel beta-helix repeat protein